MEYIKNILTRLRQWWKTFVKNHIIDEVPPNDLWSLHQYIQDKNLDWELDDYSDEF